MAIWAQGPNLLLSRFPALLSRLRLNPPKLVLCPPAWALAPPKQARLCAIFAEFPRYMKTMPMESHRLDCCLFVLASPCSLDRTSSPRPPCAPTASGSPYIVCCTCMQNLCRSSFSARMLLTFTCLELLRKSRLFLPCACTCTGLLSTRTSFDVCRPMRAMNDAQSF